MIAGIGNDIVSIERMKALFERHGESFVKRIFTDEERIEAAARHNPLEYYAGRWAAKESLAKALGCGIGGNCSWQDINIINQQNGRPEMALSGHAARQAAKINAVKIHVSISHEREYACAMVILEG